MPDPAARALANMAVSNHGHPGVADAVYPGSAAWTQGSNWGSIYSPRTALPRAFQTFRDGQFGPLEPLQPYPIDVPEPPGGRPRPRRWQYPVGWNILTGQPGTEGLMLANFQVQEDYAEQPTIPRTCIEICKQDILDLIGDDLSENIIPTASAEKAMQGNPGKRKDFESRKDEVLDFFSNPDPDGHTSGFGDWLMSLLEDNVVLDAMAINVQPTLKAGSGPCGSSLGALAALSGDTIKPLVDLHGGRPRAPQAAYQSIMWGVPRADLMDLLADFGPETSLDDVTALNPVLESLMDDVDQFGADQLLYVVQNRRSRTVYGYSPMAQALLAASILIGRQTWQFEFFQSGSLPRVFLDPGESVATAEEARQLQEAINMMGGDLAAMHQVIVLPPGAKTQPQKDVDLTSQFDEWLAALICMPFGLAISDLGITPKVAAMQSPQASKAAATTAADRSTKRSTIPRAKALKDRLFDRIIQRHLGQKDMMWSWGIEEGGESLKDKINQEIALVGGQLSTIDESRIRLGWEPLGLPETTVPIVKIATGVIPLGSPALADLADPPPPPPPIIAAPGALPPGGGPPKPGQAPPKPGGPKPPPTKPANGNGGQANAPASDTHAAARQVQGQSGNKPTSSTSSGNGSRTPPKATPKPGPATKAALDAVKVECEILRRFLRKGRPLEAFVGKTLGAGALRAGAGRGSPEGIVYAVQKAAKRQTRRDSMLDPLRAKVGAQIGTLAHQTSSGSLSPPAFTSAAVAALTASYADAYAMGSAHAADDLNGTAEDDWDDEAATKAQAQVPFLDTFAVALAGGLLVGAGMAAIDARADLYGESVTAPYEEGYGTTAAATLTDPKIIWHAQDDDNTCENCEVLDGEEFTEAELPGWPGDGEFGQDTLCLASVRCRCWLEYVEGGEPTDTSEQPSPARSTFEGPLSADDAATQTKASSARARKAYEIHKAGNPDALRDWYNAGADGAIDWGSEGDFDACVSIASQYIDNAEGFCNLRHQDAVGGPPGSEDKATKDFGLGGVPGPGGPVAMVPFDLAGPGRRRKKPKKDKAHKAVWDRDLQIFVDPQRAAEVKAQVAAQHAQPAVAVAAPFDGDQTVPNPPARTPEPAGAVTAAPTVAGVAVRAADSGRVLMIQRSMDELDPARGKWEFPGGHLEPGETPWAGALREFTEETGIMLAGGKVVNTWVDPTGIYQGFLYEVPGEASVPFNPDHEDRQVLNPDDPDGDNIEVCAWMDPATIPNNPAMRHEVAQMDWRQLLVPGGPDVVYHGLSAEFVAKAAPRRAGR